MRNDEVDEAFPGSFVGALVLSQLGAESLTRHFNNYGTSTYGYHYYTKGQ